MVILVPSICNIRFCEQVTGIPIKELNVEWGDEHLLPLIRKYNDKLIAYSIYRDGRWPRCHVVVKGKIKYFILRFNLDLKRLSRVKDHELSEKNVNLNDMYVLDKSEYDKFQKVLLVSNLNYRKSGDNTT